MKRHILLATTLLLGACTAPRTTVRTDDQSGSVVFKVKPSNAHAIVDGKDVGEARNFDGITRVLKLSPGAHVIRITAPGRQDFETRIYLSDSQEMLQVELPEASK